MKNLYRRTFVASLLALTAGSVLAATTGLSPSIFPTPGQNAATWPKFVETPGVGQNAPTGPQTANVFGQDVYRERAERERFERMKAVEIQALDARAGILRNERNCAQAATRREQLRDCREQAQARRELMAKELKAQYATAKEQARH